MGEFGNRWGKGLSLIPQQQHPQLQARLMPWTKVQFIKWFEENVKGKFNEGDLVTRIEYAPYTNPNIIPYYFEVLYVNELYSSIEYNQVCQEPSCLHVKGRSGDILKRCPSELRHLTEEELQIVYLQNTQAQGSC